MTYVNPLIILRPLALAGAVALSESPQSGRYTALITRLLELETRTHATQDDQRVTLVSEWRALYLDIQGALAEAGLLTNAPAPVATLDAETER